jgi:AcrR family transcriptional regulator
MPARRELGRAVVIDKAVQMLTADGLAEFSLKRLAEQLGVAAPAVSWHVGSRDALLLEVTDGVLAQVVVPPPRAEHWLRVFACNFRSLLVAQHELAPVVLDLLPRAPGTLRLLAAVLDELARAGFRDYDMLDRYNAYIGYVVGVTRLEVGQRSLTLRRGTETKAVLDVIAAHPSPHVQQMFGGQLPPPPLDPDYESHAESSFARGLDALLRGYELASTPRVAHRPHRSR